MSATETDKKVEAEEEKKKGGELLFCGSTCWASVIATKVRLKATWSLPLAFAPSLALKSSSLPPVARRVIALHWMLKGDATLGVAMRALAFMHGNGNLVMGMESSVIDQLLFLNSQKIESSPVRCLVSQMTNTACGADFTVWLSSVEGASILYGLTAGLPQYGQLGHGTDNEVCGAHICAAASLTELCSTILRIAQLSLYMKPNHALELQLCLLGKLLSKLHVEQTIQLLQIRMAMFTREALVVMEGLGTENRRMSGFLVVLTYSGSTIFFLLMQLFQLVP